MSIGQRLKNLFSGPARSDASPDIAHETGEEVDINEARIDAGGSGPVGFPGEPDTHASPGEDVAESEQTTG